MSVALPSRRARAWRVALIDCMRGAARTVSGLGSSTGYFSPVDMAGFQAPVQCWPDFLLAASPRAHTRCFPAGPRANQPWHQAPRRPPSLHQAFGGAALAAQGGTPSCVSAPKCATVLPYISVAAWGMGLFWAPRSTARFAFSGHSPLSKRVYTLKYGQANNRHIRTQNRVPLLIIHPWPCARGLIS